MTDRSGGALLLPYMPAGMMGSDDHDDDDVPNIQVSGIGTMGDCLIQLADVGWLVVLSYTRDTKALSTQFCCHLAHGFR